VLADDATEQSLWLATRSLGMVTGIETHNTHRLDRSPRLKRAMDIVLATAAAIPAAILTLLAATAVKIVDPGPAFYEQRRMGRNGRPIHVLKVRTMYTDSDRRLAEHLNAFPEARKDWEHRFKLADDPRILPVVGSLLRKSSIDELPQIWNVLRGDMSMVGPRPFPDYHLERFDEEFKALRMSVPPGLTGFWQVSTRSEGDLEAQKADDLFYIRNRSLWLDLYILLQTPPAVLTGMGAK
jgi:lipopolysaccharide/colanic/teichoic acid biosynthesis glycosyltransferase